MGKSLSEVTVSSALNDGSTIKNLQCVVDFENFEETSLKKSYELERLLK